MTVELDFTGEPAIEDFTAVWGAGRDAEERDPNAPRIWPDDLIPDPGPLPPSRGRKDSSLRDFIRNQPILDIYRRFAIDGVVGKESSGQVVVRCPHPNHPDTKADSARISLAKNVGVCYHEFEGWDVFDLYAWHAGYDVPEYKTDGTFPQLCEELALMLGYTVVHDGPTQIITPLHAVPDIDPMTEEEALVDLIPSSEISDIPSLDYREIFDDDSKFVRPFVERLSPYPFPDQFHLWLGLQGVGFTLGNRRALEDNPPVRANSIVCLVGDTSTFKTSSITALRDVLKDVPGIQWMGTAMSSQAILRMFLDEQPDPNDATKTIQLPVRGMIEVPELSTFITLSRNPSNDTKRQIMQLFDGNPMIAHGVTYNAAGKLEVKDHFGQMITTTQPDIVPELLTDSDKNDGFLNRVIFAFGSRKETQQSRGRRGKPPKWDDLTQVLCDMQTWALHNPVCKWDDEAGELFDHWYDTEYEVKCNRHIQKRIDLHIKKLILIISADKQEYVISRRTVEQALMFWPYLYASYNYIDGATEGQADRPEDVRVRGRLIEYAGIMQDEAASKTFSWDMVRKKNKPWFRNNLDAIKRQWSLLVEMGVFQKVDTRTRGKQVQRFRLND